MDNKIKYIRLGVIASAHGIRGQVKIRCFLENPEDLFSYGLLSDASGQRQFKLTKYGTKERLLIVSIDGVNDRNAAELLKGTELYAPARVRSNKKENSWFCEELVGLEARLASGNVYGNVIAVYNFGAGDILDIQLTGGKTEMLPLKNAFIGDVKPEEGYLIVFPPNYVKADEE